MMSNLEEVAPDRFLKAFWTSRHGRVQTHTLFKDFTEKHANVTSSIEVSSDMLTAAERYSALSNPDDPIWSPYSDVVRECVQSLRTLGARQTHPVIMSALDRFDERQVERLMRMLEVLIVRYQFVGGGRTGALEIECARIAKRIFQGQVTNASAAFKEIKKIYPSDERFRSSLREMRKATAAKTIYLFKGLEREAQRRATASPVAGGYFDSDLTVEHIWPQNPGLEWPEIDEHDSDLRAMLGNLCLLRRAANRSVGRAGWTRKRHVYAASSLLLTRNIATEYETWDSSTIIRRQNYLAQIGVQAWRFQ